MLENYLSKIAFKSERDQYDHHVGLYVGLPSHVQILAALVMYALWYKTFYNMYIEFYI